jgi:hypothetical protein
MFICHPRRWIGLNLTNHADILAKRELAQTFSEAKQWEQSEQTLLLGWTTVDQVIARRSSLPDTDPAYIQALSEKSLLLNWLVIAYAQDGKIDTALATSEEFYKYVGEHSKPWHDLGPFTRIEVAKQAWRVALDANRPDAVSLWNARMLATR